MTKLPKVDVLKEMIVNNISVKQIATQYLCTVSAVYRRLEGTCKQTRAYNPLLKRLSPLYCNKHHDTKLVHIKMSGYSYCHRCDYKRYKIAKDRATNKYRSKRRMT